MIVHLVLPDQHYIWQFEHREIGEAFVESLAYSKSKGEIQQEDQEKFLS